MKNVLAGLQPENVFHIFEEISRIPRGSGNEAAISQYLVDFAARCGYEAVCDGANNVIANIPANPAMADRGKLILQAHMDMVCEREAGCDFDFTRHAIQLCVEDGFIKAKGTTLGADDGIGMALALAIMADKDLCHPAMQFIFTSGEEVMFVGAKALDGELLDGDALIGLDCSRNDILMVSCAGISIHQFERACERTSLVDKAAWGVYDLTIKGLTGGHSAYAIAENRGNAIKMLGTLLEKLIEKPGIEILSVNGGTLINVIPANAKVSFAFPRDVQASVDELLAVWREEILAEFGETEPNLHIDWMGRPLQDGETALVAEDVKALCRFIKAFPSGAHTMQSPQMAESSSCLSILWEEDGRLKLKGSIRSNVESLHDQLETALGASARKGNFSHSRLQRERAWEYDADSKLKAFATSCWEKVHGETPGLFLPHASVEAAVFLDKMAARGLTLDVVGMGCRILDVHTPQERLEIASVGRTYDLLRYMVEHFDYR